MTTICRISMWRSLWHSNPPKVNGDRVMPPKFESGQFPMAVESLGEFEDLNAGKFTVCVLGLSKNEIYPIKVVDNTKSHPVHVSIVYKQDLFRSK